MMPFLSTTPARAACVATPVGRASDSLCCTISSSPKILMNRFRKKFCVAALITTFVSGVTAQKPRGRAATAIPANTLLRILRAEDERRWDDNLRGLLSDKDAQIRKRAALAAGRIGDERAVPDLSDLLRKDTVNDVRQMAAFAIGETESPAGADALRLILDDTYEPSEVRARAVEALGKITAALPDSDKDHKPMHGKAILDVLRFEAGRRSMPDRLTILLGLTAALRAKPDGAGPVVAKFLGYSDPRIVADALNTLARLRLKDGNNEARQLLTKHSDPVVRANAARMLGAAEDKAAFDALLDRALHDDDLRVRVSAIRALGSLKDPRAAQPLCDQMVAIIDLLKKEQALNTLRRGLPLPRQSEMLELLTAIGNMEAAKGGDSEPSALPEKPTRPGPRALAMIPEFQKLPFPFFGAPEFHIASAKIDPDFYLASTFLHPDSMLQNGVFANWRYPYSIAEGFRTIGTLNSEIYGKDILINQAGTKRRLHAMLDDRRLPKKAVSSVLTAYIAFKPDDAGETLRKHLNSDDVIIRSTAAELLGNEPPNDINSHALVDALKGELPRTEKGEMNDAALAILEALAKQKNKDANDAIKTALDSSDHLIRRKAVALLKANGVGDFSDRIGTVKTRNTEVDYRRAISRIGKHVTATVVTSKGSFTIEFLPEDAPLTVDSFITLARKGFFNGQTIPRVVPNFVIQAGDPRGDTNGGPGYQIRCEINEVPYERGAVGMALSGKDTGGSQWFVTHSPQPHLDGGYTVFGRVISGMNVVDNIARGDIIRMVIVNGR